MRFYLKHKSRTSSSQYLTTTKLWNINYGNKIIRGGISLSR